MKYMNFYVGIFCIFVLSACSSQTDSLGQSQSNSIVGEEPDYAIAVALYTDRRIPEDFYHNELPDDNAFYVTYNVKNTDLVPIYERTGMPVYELSTDDFSQALDWAEIASVYRPVYRPLIDYSETDFYFEFMRIDTDNPLYIDVVRVFKRSVLDRSGVDSANPDNYFQGTINPTMLSKDFCKRIIEYLWTFTFANNYGTFIIDSEITEHDSEYLLTLVEARLDMDREDACDTIRIYELNYEIDKATGDINKEENFVRHFTARRTDYDYEIC